jgi:hypothetical protein
MLTLVELLSSSKAFRQSASTRSHALHSTNNYQCILLTLQSSGCISVLQENEPCSKCSTPRMLQNAEIFEAMNSSRKEKWSLIPLWLKQKILPYD